MSAAAEARPLRVLMVHERFPPDYAGGGEYFVLETARHLQQRGHRVDVLTCGDPSITQFEGIRTARLPMSRYRFNFAWKTVAHHARDADVIQTFSYHATYPAYRAGRVLGKPVVCGVLALFDEVWREMRGPVVGRMFQRMERFLLGLPLDRRVFISEGSREVARKLGLTREEDVVLEPGISLADYRSAPDKRDVVFSGKLDVRKGIDAVLQAAALLPHVPFRIVGWGERFDEIERAKPANVALERFRDRDHLAQVLARARIFLFPSKAETFGLVVAEAMASGCAVVSTLPIPFEGVHLRDGDAASVTDAVKRLWADPEACRVAGEANERAAQRYSWPRHVEQLEGIYLELLRQHSKNTHP